MERRFGNYTPGPPRGSCWRNPLCHPETAARNTRLLTRPTLLLIGFAGVFRRSELAARALGIPFGSNPKTCPVRAYRRSLEASDITVGPVFRAVDHHGRIAADAITPQVVALLVKRWCTAAGLMPRVSARTACAADLRRRPRATARANARSCDRRATSRCRWCGATFARANSSTTTARASSVCEPLESEDRAHQFRESLLEKIRRFANLPDLIEDHPTAT